MDYIEYSPERAYELVCSSGLVLICTKSVSGAYDLAPIAWICPLDNEPVSRLLFVCDPGHATYDNLVQAGTFAVALPDFRQRDLCMRAGGATGRDGDKYEALDISSFGTKVVDARIPEGVAGWLECRLIRTEPEGSVSIVMAEVLGAWALDEYWKRRIHYVSEGIMYAPGRDL